MTDKEWYTKHITGWLVGRARDGKTPVVYLYGELGEWPSPCYPESFADLPEEIESSLEPMVNGAPPSHRLGIELGVILPCDFLGIFEYFGEPNEIGYRRAKYVCVST